MLLAALICTPSYSSAEDVPSRPLLPGKVAGDGLVTQLAHSPDGRLLAVLTTTGFQVRDAEDGRLLNFVLHSVPMVRAVDWSPDGKRLAMAAGGVEIWDPLGNGPERTIPSLPRDGKLDTVAWSPDGRQIAAGSKQAVVIFDVVSGSRVDLPAVGERSLVQNVRGGFSWPPDSSQLAVVSGAWNSEVIDFWDTRQGNLLKTIPVSNGKPPICGSDACDFGAMVLTHPKSLVRWSPDGEMLAVASQYSDLSLWRRDSRLLWRRARVPNSGNATFLDWSSDGKLLHVGSSFELRYVRPDTGSTTFRLKAKSYLPGQSPVSVSKDEQHRAEWSNPGVDLFKGQEKTPHAHIEVSTAWNLEAFSQDLTRMVATSLAGVKQVWDLATGQRLAQLPPQILGGYNSAWSPNLDLLAHVDPTGRNLQVVRVRDGAVQYAKPLPKGLYFLGSEPSSRAWSPDGESLIVPGVQGTPSVVVAPRSGRVTEPPLGSGPLVWGPLGAAVRLPDQPALFCLQSTDRRWAVTVDSTWMFKVWDLSQDPPVPGPQLRISPMGGVESSLALSPDGKRIAFLSGPDFIDIWDVATARIVERWTATSSSELHAVFWRTKLTAVGDLRGAVRLWQEP